MPRDIKVGLRLEADGKGFRGEIRVSKKAIEQFSASARSAGRSAQRTTRATASLGRSVQQAGSQAASAHGKVASYAAAWGSLAIVGYRVARVFV